MDARAYRLPCLKETDVFEVDFPEVLNTKTNILEAATKLKLDQRHLSTTAKSIKRVAADVTNKNWFQNLQISGFVPERNTIWVLEGLLYYLSHTNAIEILKMISQMGNLSHTVLLADFMNKPATTLASSYHFYSDWPDQLLPTLGFSDVKLSQIGDPDANFGLSNDPLNLFNKLRNLPRSIQTNPDDGTPCCRLYLVQASSSPN